MSAIFSGFVRVWPLKFMDGGSGLWEEALVKLLITFHDDLITLEEFLM